MHTASPLRTALQYSPKMAQDAQFKLGTFYDFETGYIGAGALERGLEGQSR